MNNPVPCRETLWLNDFASIFAHMWYRDFPVEPTHRGIGRRADWTIHIGVAVRGTADLMGLFTHFESGGRTDAILRDNAGRTLAALEWEWNSLESSTLNELDKLKDRCSRIDFQGIRFACLIGYVSETHASIVIDDIAARWNPDLPTLLLVVVLYNPGPNDTRKFAKMVFYAIREGRRVVLREQKARPWEVDGSRWQRPVSE